MGKRGGGQSKRETDVSAPGEFRPSASPEQETPKSPSVISNIMETFGDLHYDRNSRGTLQGIATIFGSVGALLGWGYTSAGLGAEIATAVAGHAYAPALGIAFGAATGVAAPYLAVGAAITTAAVAYKGTEFVARKLGMNS